MRNILLGAATAALALAPSVASAAFVLTVPEITTDVPATATTVNVDIFFSEIDPATANNTLAGFAVRLDVDKGSATGIHLPTNKPTGVGLSPATADGHPYIFLTAGTNPDDGTPAPARPAIPANDEAYGPATITAAGLADAGREPAIPLGAGVLRVPLVIEPGVAPGVYALTLDPLVTSFANAAGDPIAVSLDNGFINVTPEPASLSLLGLGGLFSLRRRRMA
jgi:hypothetical protein